MTSAKTDLLTALRASWSNETTGHWDPHEPGRHQCAVSALVIQDHLGGDIVRNKIHGRLVWFTILADGTELFHDPVYEGCKKTYPHSQPQTREQVMIHRDMPRRYEVLAGRVADRLKKHDFVADNDGCGESI